MYAQCVALVGFGSTPSLFGFSFHPPRCKSTHLPWLPKRTTTIYIHLHTCSPAIRFKWAESMPNTVCAWGNEPAAAARVPFPSSSSSCAFNDAARRFKETAAPTVSVRVAGSKAVACSSGMREASTRTS